MTQPRALYDRGPGTPLDVDREFYGRLAREAESRTPRERLGGPTRSGRAGAAPGAPWGRMGVMGGPRVADFNVWTRHTPRERFGAPRPRQLYGTHVTTFDRLWSCL